MIEQYNKPSTESMQSFVGEIKQLCQVSSNMQTLNLSLVQKWFLTEQRKENLHHHEHKEQQVKVTFSIRQYVLIRRIIIFLIRMTQTMFSRLVMHNWEQQYMAATFLPMDCMNCRIAHLCGRIRVFSHKVDSSDEASEATRALLEIIGHRLLRIELVRCF